MKYDFVLSRESPASPLILWGGSFPSGSIKYLTFSNYFQEFVIDKAVPGFVEMSSASTALALSQIASEHGLGMIALIEEGAQDYLLRHGFRGRCITYKNLTEAFDHCARLEREGWHWPRQLTNRTLIASAEGWVRELLPRVLFDGIRKIYCGFGTGATLAAFHRVFSPYGIEVLGVQNSDFIMLKGWRNFERQNLAAEDLFSAYAEKLPLIYPGVADTSSSYLMALMSAAGADQQNSLIICHSENPSSKIFKRPAIAGEKVQSE